MNTILLASMLQGLLQDPAERSVVAPPEARRSRQKEPELLQ